MDNHFLSNSMKTTVLTKIVFTILFTFFLVRMNAQKNAIEFSVAHVLDKNFNRFADYFLLGTPPQMDTRYSAAATLGYTRKISNNWYLLSGGRLVLRRVNYVQRATVVGGFYHHMVELPLGLRRAFQLNDNFGFNADFGAGVNLNSSRNESSIHFNHDELNTRIQFINYQKPGVFAFLGLSLFARISEFNSIAFNMAYQHQFTSMFRLEGRDNLFLSYGTPVKPSYLSFGFTLRHTIKK